jgi:putative flippase GtrA
MKISPNHSCWKADAQMIRYIIGGSATAALGYGSIFIMVEWCGVNYLISANIAGFVAYLSSYIVNKYFVFKNFEKSHFKYGSRFVILQVCLWVVSNGLLFTGVDIAHIHYLIAAVAVGAISAGINFVFLRIIVFAK